MTTVLSVRVLPLYRKTTVTDPPQKFVRFAFRGYVDEGIERRLLRIVGAWCGINR